MFSFITLLIVSFLFLIFFISAKSVFWTVDHISGFECGFSSFLSTSSSFSVQFFIISVIFLFLDLELVFIFMFFFNFFSFKKIFFFFFFFIFTLMLGIFLEWWDGLLEWVI